VKQKEIKTNYYYIKMMKYSGIVVFSTAAIALHGCGDKDEDVKATEKIYKEDLKAMEKATEKAEAEFKKLQKADPNKKAENQKTARKHCEDAKAATDKKVEEAKKGKKDEKKTPAKDAFMVEFETCKMLGEEKDGP